MLRLPTRRRRTERKYGQPKDILRGLPFSVVVFPPIFPIVHDWRNTPKIKGNSRSGAENAEWLGFSALASESAFVLPCARLLFSGTATLDCLMCFAAGRTAEVCGFFVSGRAGCVSDLAQLSLREYMGKTRTMARWVCSHLHDAKRLWNTAGAAALSPEADRQPVLRPNIWIHATRSASRLSPK